MNQGRELENFNRRTFVSFLAPLVICVFWINSHAEAKGGYATVTLVKGNVKIFSHPSPSADGPSPRALFEGKYYTVKPARPGDQVSAGNILRTLPGGQAKVVYANGDHILLGPGSAYQVAGTPRTPAVKLRYGKLRSVISKKGPRKRFRIRTASATMGVRGTDFFVAHLPNENKSRVSVLRGAVQVTPKAKKAKPVKVTKGFSGKIAGPETSPKKGKDSAKKPQDTVVAVYQTHKRELVDIQRNSVISKKDRAIAGKKQKEIDELEQKSRETTLKDIEESDPELFKKVKGRSINAIHTASVRSLYKKAPEGPSKPGESDLDELGEGVYERYFNID